MVDEGPTEIGEETSVKLEYKNVFILKCAKLHTKAKAAKNTVF
jgi:hypothetical protein